VCSACAWTRAASRQQATDAARGECLQHTDAAHEIRRPAHTRLTNSSMHRRVYDAQERTQRDVCTMHRSAHRETCVRCRCTHTHRGVHDARVHTHTQRRFIHHPHGHNARHRRGEKIDAAATRRRAHADPSLLNRATAGLPGPHPVPAALSSLVLDAPTRTRPGGLPGAWRPCCGASMLTTAAAPRRPGFY
jgi:hypothetical protein